MIRLLKLTLKKGKQHGIIEKQHEKRYRDLMVNIKTNKVFQRDEKVIWRCRNCGYLHQGTDAPEKCPACDHATAHFELLGENR